MIAVDVRSITHNPHLAQNTQKQIENEHEGISQEGFSALDVSFCS